MAELSERDLHVKGKPAYLRTRLMKRALSFEKGAAAEKRAWTYSIYIWDRDNGADRSIIRRNGFNCLEKRINYLKMLQNTQKGLNNVQR